MRELCQNLLKSGIVGLESRCELEALTMATSAVAPSLVGVRASAPVYETIIAEVSTKIHDLNEALSRQFPCKRSGPRY
jgi:hypothetical protein